MSTAAVTPDPYASIAKPIQADPYAAIAKPIAPPPPTEKSLWQKAKDNFNANTQGAQPGDGAVVGALENFGAGAGDFVRSVAHLPTTVTATMSQGIDDLMHGDNPATAQLVRLGQALHAQPMRTLGNIGTGMVAGEAVAPLVEPLVGAANVAGKGVGRAALLGKTPEAAYESALKPSTALSQADRAAIVKTGIENELPVSKGGLEKLGDRIEALNQAIKDEVAADPTRPIDPNKVAMRADDARANFAKQVNAGGDLSAIEASKQQFLQEQGATSGNPAPPMNAIDAQEMKQGTYKVLKGKFGEQGSASVEAQKSLARGLKEEIATQFPEISKLNAAESKLLDLQPILERAVNRISNHQLVGIGTPVAGAAAKAVTGSGTAGAVAGVLKAVLDNPAVKSRLAIAVSKGAKIPYSQAAARVGAYAAALESSASGSQAYSSADNPNQPTTPQP